MSFNRKNILTALSSGEHLSTRRGLYPEDIESFVTLVKQNPGKAVRVYSKDGFVPNSYKWPCYIEYIQRDKQGRVGISFAGAQRSHGDGPRATVANRRVC